MHPAPRRAARDFGQPGSHCSLAVAPPPGLRALPAAPDRAERGKLDSQRAVSALRAAHETVSWPVPRSCRSGKRGAGDCGRHARPRQRGGPSGEWCRRARSRIDGCRRWYGSLREARVDLWLERLGPAGPAQRDLARRDALNSPAADGFALGKSQRLGAVHGKDCEMKPGLDNDPGQPRVAQIGTAWTIIGRALRRPPGAAEQRSGQHCGQQFIKVRARLPVCNGSRTGWFCTGAYDRLVISRRFELGNNYSAENQTPRQQKVNCEATSHGLPGTGFSLLRKPKTSRPASSPVAAGVPGRLNTP
jgi:hypothetical protein